MFSETKVKVFMKLFLFVTVFCAQILAYQGGSSTSKHKQDNHGNYQFKYDIKDHKGADNFRMEKGDKHGVKGSYGLKDVDGRMRVVDYIADKNGFRAKINSNEPGIGDKGAAHASLNGYAPETHHGQMNENNYIQHNNQNNDHTNAGGEGAPEDVFDQSIKQIEKMVGQHIVRY